MGCGSSKNTDTQENNNKPDEKAEQENKDGTDENKEEKGKKENNEEVSQEMRDKFETESLEAHNKYRALHGASELTISRELCDIARKWADHLAEQKAFEHSKTEDRKCSKGSTGENLYYSGSTGELEIDGKAAVDSWYDEIKDYNFEKAGFTMNTGHFTQVIWEGTKELGIAFATFQDGEYRKLVVVGNYYPAGNVMKEFEDNVKPLQGEECKKDEEKKEEKEEKKVEKEEKKKKPVKNGKGK